MERLQRIILPTVAVFSGSRLRLLVGFTLLCMLLITLIPVMRITSITHAASAPISVEAALDTLDLAATMPSLTLEAEASPVIVADTNTFTATATLSSNPNPHDFQINWNFDSTVVSEAKNSAELTLVFSQKRGFTQIGQYPISATLYDKANLTTPIVSNTLSLNVVGGVIDVQFNPSRADGKALVGALTSIDLSLPAARADTYRLVVDFGDQSSTTTIVTSTLEVPMISTVSEHRYRSPGNYTVVAKLYPSDGPISEASLLATGTTALPIGVEVAVYLPLIVKPEPPPLACNDIEDNDTPTQANSLDPSIGQSLLRRSGGLTCQGSLQDDPEREDDYYTVRLEPNQRLVVILQRIPSGANFNLYLYSGLSGSAVNLVGSSENLDQADDRIDFENGSTAQIYTLRIFSTTKSTVAENTYLITATIN